MIPQDLLRNISDIQPNYLVSIFIAFSWKSLNSWTFIFLYLGCQQGKVADVTLLLDTSQHLTDKQFENQIQRAEQMVRLFRNFKTNDRHRYNRIAIITISDSIVKHVVKFKSQLNSPKYSRTDELVHILRKLHSKFDTILLTILKKDQWIILLFFSFIRCLPNL